MAKFSQTGIESGASDLGAIVQVDGKFLEPFGNTPNDILQRHRAALEGVDLFPASRIMDAGNRFEDAIRQWFEDEYNVTVELAEQGYRSPNCNLVASLDGIIRDGMTITDYLGKTYEIDEPLVIDFKCPTWKPENPEAHHYMLQGHGQMECTGYNWFVLAQLDRVSCNWTISVWHRHDGVITAIREAVDTFWGHMANDTDYPPITPSEASRLTPGNPMAAPHDLTHGPSDVFDTDARNTLIAMAGVISRAKEEIKDAKKREDNAKMAVMDIMVGVEKIIVPGAKISWSTTEYKAQPEKITPAKPAHTGRRFSVKEI